MKPIINYSDTFNIKKEVNLVHPFQNDEQTSVSSLPLVVLSVLDFYMLSPPVPTSTTSKLISYHPRPATPLTLDICHKITQSSKQNSTYQSQRNYQAYKAVTWNNSTKTVQTRATNSCSHNQEIGQRPFLGIMDGENCNVSYGLKKLNGKQ